MSIDSLIDLSMLDAVIFDMDGLLVDSEPFWQKAERAVFESIGVSLSESMLLETTGLRIDEVVKYWAQRFAWNSDFTHEQIVAQVIERMSFYLATEAKAMAGVYEVLEFFKQRGTPMAIASSSSLALIQIVVKSLHIASYFQVLQSAEFEIYGKPHPGVYLSACAALGVDPVRTLALEDSINGVLSAKAAKMKVIAVPSKHDFMRSEFMIADKILPSLIPLIDAIA